MIFFLFINILDRISLKWVENEYIWGIIFFMKIFFYNSFGDFIFSCLIIIFVFGIWLCFILFFEFGCLDCDFFIYFDIFERWYMWDIWVVVIKFCKDWKNYNSFKWKDSKLLLIKKRLILKWYLDRRFFIGVW